MLDLSKPNNILGFHYVRAIHTSGSAMKPYTTARIASQYHDAELPGDNSRIASATSIRRALIEKERRPQRAFSRKHLRVSWRHTEIHTEYGTARKTIFHM